MAELSLKYLDAELDSFLTVFIDEVNSSFPRQLLSSYLIGSLAHGGYLPHLSDIDIVVFMRQSTSAQEILTLRQRLWRHNHKLGRLLNIYWTDELLSGGHFPIAERVDFFANGKLIYGDQLNLPSYLQPQLNQIQPHALQQLLPAWQQLALRFSQAKDISSDDSTYIHTLLMPARLLQLYRKGTIDSWDESLLFFDRETSAEEINKKAVLLAGQYRRKKATFEQILPLRKKLPKLVEQTLHLLKTSE